MRHAVPAGVLVYAIVAVGCEADVLADFLERVNPAHVQHVKITGRLSARVLQGLGRLCRLKVLCFEYTAWADRWLVPAVVRRMADKLRVERVRMVLSSKGPTASCR